MFRIMRNPYIYTFWEKLRTSDINAGGECSNHCAVNVEVSLSSGYGALETKRLEKMDFIISPGLS
jgi:hypothetical protein